MTQPSTTRPRFYNEAERNVINPFKVDYMKTTTPAERKAIAQIEIFPALFTYWSSIGLVISPAEQDRRTEVR